MSYGQNSLHAYIYIYTKLSSSSMRTPCNPYIDSPLTMSLDHGNMVFWFPVWLRQVQAEVGRLGAAEALVQHLLLAPVRCILLPFPRVLKHPRGLLPSIPGAPSIQTIPDLQALNKVGKTCFRGLWSPTDRRILKYHVGLSKNQGP